jgi:hypothetical protein
LGSSSLVKFLCTKVFLLIFRNIRKPAYREGRSREVSREGPFSLLPSEQFESSNEGEDLEGTSSRHGFTACPSRRDIREFGSIKRDFTRKTDSGGSHQITDHTELADTTVLDLDVSEAVEL